MLEYKESPLKSKTEAYADRITLLYDYLITNKHEHVMATRIYRSGTSIGANVMESRFAQSGADFINKLNIALKEAGETEYWLGRLYKSGKIDKRGYESMKSDNTEIVKMLVASIKTMKKKLGK